jgi:hypothetical protein
LLLDIVERFVHDSIVDGGPVVALASPLGSGEPSRNILHYGEHVHKKCTRDGRFAYASESFLCQSDVFIVPTLDLYSIGGFRDR